jgi:hypothetical protein
MLAGIKIGSTIATKNILFLRLIAIGTTYDQPLHIAFV